MKLVRNSIFLLVALAVLSQRVFAASPDDKAVPYGNNPAAGHYLQVADAKIYYEVYGAGPPVVLLHGGLFGYIDEFSNLIPKLSPHFTVIAIAFRGHGKSELGKQPLSDDLFANDVLAVTQQVTKEPVDVVGFSVGAMVSYVLTIKHPELVHRLIAVGGPISSSGAVESKSTEAEGNAYNNPAELEKLMPQIVGRRKAFYADPNDWDRLVIAMGKMAATDRDIPVDQMKAIQCPTLIAAGDTDRYTKTEHFVEIYRLLQHGELAIVPGCGHTVFKCNAPMMDEMVAQFLEQKKVPGMDK